MSDESPTNAAPTPGDGHPAERHPKAEFYRQTASACENSGRADLAVLFESTADELDRLHAENARLRDVIADRTKDIQHYESKLTAANAENARLRDSLQEALVKIADKMDRITALEAVVAKLPAWKLRLAARLLDIAGDQFDSNGCNELDEKTCSMLTPQQWDAIRREIEPNEPSDYYDGTPYHYDAVLMGHLSEELEAAAAQGVQDGN